uniref:Polypeptide N-acetylgalactosaminyltransferase 5 n=1 Tax=Sinocyclocheilus grahami TaxID=75366 RepID=A0A672SJT9_SINGR
MKFRKYLRGRGRVLAFVFIASVIWLLFDIAALRISIINDVNQDLKERESVLNQGRRKDNVLKHPLQKVNIDKKEFLKNRFFNVFLSEQIPIDRAIPDTRPQICSENLVHDDLPSTSVIFCFVDEVWSTLLRSVHSVLNRSPPHLLKEIILVDDCSTKDYLKEQLDVYISQFPKIRIIRLKERQGLIRARIAGAAAATGEVLTFLDSHVECNVGWLEPLLERVYLDHKKVVCPVIEVISDKDMRLNMTYTLDRSLPHMCPVMAGGLFSIDKSYFYELGAYDPGLDVWGGENMEISFKIWMCGGEIEIIPCSRVGHIFRGDNPYKFPKDRVKTVERNLARVAEVWLDDYKDTAQNLISRDSKTDKLINKWCEFWGRIYEIISQYDCSKCFNRNWITCFSYG